MALERIDVLLKMYEEHANQARQHENQRAQMTTIILALASVVITVITLAKLALYTIPMSLVLVCIGGYGWLFALKHYERNRMHTTIMSVFRDAIDTELGAGRTGGSASNTKKSLKELRTCGEKKHYKNYPKRLKEQPSNSEEKDARDMARSWVARVGLWKFWAAPHIAVLCIGLLLLVLTLIHPIGLTGDDVIHAEVKNVQEFTAK